MGWRTSAYSTRRDPGQPRMDRDSFLELSPAAAHDLGLDEIIAAFTPDREHQKEIRNLFSRLPRDPVVITYRQAVLDDLLANPELVDRFASLLPVIDSLFEYRGTYRSHREMTWLHEVVRRTGELQNMIDCFEGMGEILRSVEGRLHSDGLRELHEEIRKAQSDPKYQSLVKELPELLSKLRGCASITIGVNLDASLRPIQASLLSVNEKPFTDQTLLSRLFGLRKDSVGIAPLHSVPRRNVDGPYALPIDSELGWAVEPMMVPLFADLAKVLERTAIPIADQLSQYAGLHGKLFMDLRQGLLFYLGAIRFIRRFQKMGLPICRPQIVSAEERRSEVKELLQCAPGVETFGIGGWYQTSHCRERHPAWTGRTHPHPDRTQPGRQDHLSAGRRRPTDPGSGWLLCTREGCLPQPFRSSFHTFSTGRKARFGRWTFWRGSLPVGKDIRTGHPSQPGPAERVALQHQFRRKPVPGSGSRPDPTPDWNPCHLLDPLARAGQSSG